MHFAHLLAESIKVKRNTHTSYTPAAPAPMIIIRMLLPTPSVEASQVLSPKVADAQSLINTFTFVFELISIYFSRILCLGPVDTPFLSSVIFCCVAKRAGRA